MTDDTFDNLVDEHQDQSRPEQVEEEEQRADYLEINWDAYDCFIEGQLGSVTIHRHPNRHTHVRIYGSLEDLEDEGAYMAPLTPGTAVRVQRDGETILTGELVDIIDNQQSVTYVVDEGGSLRFARGWVRGL